MNEGTKLVSGVAGDSCIQREYNEAKETARAYLRALEVLNPGGGSTRKHREREARLIRDGIGQGRWKVLELPNDPVARHATVLARRYLHDDRDDNFLDALIGNADNPAHRMALEVLKSELVRAGADVPDRLRAWEPEGSSAKGRWRREPTRNYRIGMVVEALVMGKDTLVRRGETGREREQLQGDLQAVNERAGRAGEELSSEDVLESLNKMQARPWRHRNGGKGLRGDDLVELTRRRSDEPGGVDGILADVEVRKHFPNLYATRNDATKHKGFAYSICDAVADVLNEAGQSGSYRTILRAWRAYRRSDQTAV